MNGTRRGQIGTRGLSSLGLRTPGILEEEVEGVMIHEEYCTIGQVGG